MPHGAQLPNIPERSEHIHSADPNLSKSKMVSALENKGVVRNHAKGYRGGPGLPPKPTNGTRSNYEIRSVALAKKQ
jgi:hypothetical protein